MLASQAQRQLAGEGLQVVASVSLAEAQMAMAALLEEVRRGNRDDRS